MNETLRQARIAAKHREELVANDMGLHWLSFADPTKPKGSQFLGVLIVEAYGLTDAILKTRAMGLNPGGEVMSFRVDPAEYPEAIRNRLLTKADLGEYGVPT